MDNELRAIVEDVIAAKPRRFVTAAIVLGCLKKETGLVGTFSKLDRQLHWNIEKARQFTGCAPDLIWRSFIIQSGPFQGQICKFNCEPAYWEWSRRLRFPLSVPDRLRLSASIGLGQLMTRNLVARVAPNGSYIMPQSQWQPYIQKFMGSRPLQVSYCAGMLDDLLVQAAADVKLAKLKLNNSETLVTNPIYGKDPVEVALTRYNAGHIWHITDYGKIAALFAREIKREFGGG